MEVQLQIKRIGLDNTWQISPYQIKDEAHAERLTEWLKQSLPPFMYQVVTISNADDLQDT